jgi:hypothetical protein
MGMSALFELEYEPHFERYNQLFGGLDQESVAHAHREAQHDHSLVVCDAFRDAFTSTVNLSHYLTEEQAKYYLRYGAGRRMMMMWYSYRHLIFTADPKRTDPLSEDEGQELGKDVNLIYMHLRGTLDNFAWCMIYEKFPNRASIDPRNVGLFTSSVRPILKELGIEEAIQEYADWNREVKDRRDPVAHRIPLTVPPSILNSDEGDERARLQQAWDELLVTMIKQYSPDVQTEMDSLWHRMDRMGTFLPIFVHHPHQAPIPIYPTIPADMANLVKISALVRKAIAPADVPIPV